MQMLESILYDCVYHSAPIILCVLGGIFAYKANVLNIALEGMMLNGAFISVLTFYYTRSMALTVLFTLLSTLVYGLVFSYFGITLKGNVIVIADGGPGFCSASPAAFDSCRAGNTVAIFNRSY